MFTRPNPDNFQTKSRVGEPPTARRALPDFIQTSRNVDHFLEVDCVRIEPKFYGEDGNLPVRTGL